jgi:hypothetical protein
MRACHAGLESMDILDTDISRAVGRQVARQDFEGRKIDIQGA